MLAFSQIISPMSFNLDVKFPTMYLGITNFLGFLGFEILPKLSLECWFKAYDYCDFMKSLTIMPLVVGSTIGTIGFIHYRQTGKREVLNGYIYAVLLWTFLVFLQVSTCLFYYLNCVPFVDLDQAFLMKVGRAWRFDFS